MIYMMLGKRQLLLPQSGNGLLQWTSPMIHTVPEVG
jgi:hypothetical protein